MRDHLALLALLLSLLLYAGCATAPPPATELDPKPLGPGECITVQTVVNTVHQIDLKTTHTIDAAGAISLPPLGQIHVAGLTIRQAAEEIARAWAKQKPAGPTDRVFVVARCP